MYLFLITKNISFYFVKSKQKYFLWLFSKLFSRNFRFKRLFNAGRVIYPSGKEKPATGLKMGKTKKAGGNPANP
jgi:hypothetical protein